MKNKPAGTPWRARINYIGLSEALDIKQSDEVGTYIRKGNVMCSCTNYISAVVCNNFSSHLLF